MLPHSRWVRRAVKEKCRTFADKKQLMPGVERQGEDSNLWIPFVPKGTPN
jgi:hypothetical protein